MKTSGDSSVPFEVEEHERDPAYGDPLIGNVTTTTANRLSGVHRAQSEHEARLHRYCTHGIVCHLQPKYNADHADRANTEGKQTVDRLHTVVGTIY